MFAHVLVFGRIYALNCPFFRKFGFFSVFLFFFFVVCVFFFFFCFFVFFFFCFFFFCVFLFFFCFFFFFFFFFFFRHTNLLFQRTDPKRRCSNRSGTKNQTPNQQNSRNENRA